MSIAKKPLKPSDFAVSADGSRNLRYFFCVRRAASIVWAVQHLRALQTSTANFLSIPCGVRGLFYHVPVQIGCAVLPPDRSPLPQVLLRSIDGAMCFGLGSRIADRFGVLNRPASRHQLMHKCRLPLGFDSRIGQSP